MNGAPRRLPARIGIAALNLFMPGLGLLRLGRARAAFLCLGSVVAAYLLLILFYAVVPELGFTGYAILAGLLILALLGAIIASMRLSWRSSRERGPVGRWSRWYVILLAVVAGALLFNLLTQLGHSFYKPFYLPAEAMAPTILENDRIVASMRLGRDIRRGDVLLFDTGGNTYIKRVAGLPGDRIAMVSGVVVLNGRPVPQQLVGSEPADKAGAPGEARRLREQFPGEAAPHEIYDLGPTEYDDMPEQQVRSGHLFVLGDNRDRSADSRVPRSIHGVEQLPLANVRGRALFYTFGPSGRWGEPVVQR